MKKRTKQCFTAVTIAAMVGGSIGAGVPAMAAKVTLPKTAKVAVGAKKVLKLKNNKRTESFFSRRDQSDVSECRGCSNSC